MRVLLAPGAAQPEAVRSPPTGWGLRITLGFSSHVQGGRALTRWARHVGRHLQVPSGMLTWAWMEEGLCQGPGVAKPWAGKHVSCWLKLPQPQLPALQQQPLLTILPRRCDLRVCNVARGHAESISAVCSQTGRRRVKTRER